MSTALGGNQGHNQSAPNNSFVFATIANHVGDGIIHDSAQDEDHRVGLCMVLRVEASHHGQIATVIQLEADLVQTAFWIRIAESHSTTTERFR